MWGYGPLPIKGPMNIGLSGMFGGEGGIRTHGTLRYA